MTTFNVNDYGFSAAALESEYGRTAQQEHPAYPRSLWSQAMLRSRQTMTRYWGWVELQLNDERDSLNQDEAHDTHGLALNQ